MKAAADSRLALLAQQSPGAFLVRYWHKEALLARNAIAGFAGLFSREELFALAGRDDVESRLVTHSGRRYTLAHGPFRKTQLRALPPRDWTLLVQGVNLHSDAADLLLRRFAFLPYARLDDVMVSYATEGGGVGPHFDSYDVFLLQGTGRRRWRYGRQDDLSLRPDLPVKILRRFTPTHDVVLLPGDMLYLPPAYAHDGVALEPCTTYSIGFRAVAHTELAQHFFDHLRDRVDLPGRYADPDAKPTREPARIDKAMRRSAVRALTGARWNDADIARFLGVMLSEPKATVIFDAPKVPLSRAAFGRELRKRGVVLDRRTQWLYDERALYLNGEAHPWPSESRGALIELANARKLPPSRAKAFDSGIIGFLHEGYVHGYLHPG